MDCEKALELMNLYIDAEINETEKKELFAHMEDCISCKEEFELISNMVTELRAVEFLPLPPTYHQELMEKIENSKVAEIAFGKTKTNTPSWKKYSSIAAAFLVLVAVSISGNKLINNNNNQPEMLRSSENPMPMAMPAGESAPQMDTRANSMGVSSANAGVALAPDALKGSSDEGLPEVALDVALMNVEDKTTTETQRKRIKTAYIGITVDNFDIASQTLKGNIEGLGGYTENFNSYVYYEDINTDISLKRGELKVRVDKDEYPQVLDFIKTIGTVSSESEQLDDVTSQYVDTKARLDVKKAEETRLIELLTKAETVVDIMAIETRLSEVRGYIESHEAQLQAWDKLENFSTINVTIEEKMPKGISTMPTNFGEKVKDSFIRSINFVVDGSQKFVLGLVAFSVPGIMGAVAIFIIYKIGKLVYLKKKNEKPKV